MTTAQENLPIPTSTITKDVTANDQLNKIVTLTAKEVEILDETKEAIREIYVKSVLDGMLKIGNIILEKVYENDFKSVSFDNSKENKKKRKWQIFKQLADESEKGADEGKGFPRKTYLYNAVRLAVDNVELNEINGYSQLSVSHQIEILKLPTFEQKEDAIIDILENQKTVGATRKHINSLLGKDKSDDALSLIKKLDSKSSIDDFVATIIYKVGDDVKLLKKVITAGKRKYLAIDKEYKELHEKRSLITGLNEALQKIAHKKASKAKRTTVKSEE